MPVYDLSLRDFLQIASKQNQEDQNDFFPFEDRVEMLKRICSGLMYMNTKFRAHRDIKARKISKIKISISEKTVIKRIIF